jgi:peptidoglycan/LPS O-acetylase OafA/YrhL
MEKIKYSKTITSLRGLSVLGVLLYHSKFSFFKGGYLGVDVFFVISGFLIGNIIFSDHFNLKFSFKDFYIRRLRRLLPALVFTIIFTYVISYFIFLPDDFKVFNYSIPYSLLFVGNIFFWKTNDYFSPSTDIMPLSHLWSLSIEEQFYLFFPFFIFLLFKVNYFRKNIKTIIFIGILLSFLYTISNFYNLPFDCPTTNCIQVTNFYWLHTRAWEILAGVLINFIQIRTTSSNNKYLLTGFYMIVLSFLFVDSTYKHPGFITLPIIFGTTLVILSSLSNDNNILSRSNLLYFLGKISYSLYLIHYPFFVIRNYFGLKLIIFGDIDILPLLLIVLSIIISYFMWKYIETPFRSYKFIKNKIFLFTSTILVATLFFISTTSIVPVKPLNDEYNKFNFSTNFSIKRDCFFEDIPEVISNIDACMMPKDGKENVLILGSSVAKNIYNGLSKATEDSIHLDLVVVTGCPPLIEKYEFDISNFSENKCEVLYTQINKNLKEKSYSKIILSYQWGELVKKEVSEDFTLLDYTFDKIISQLPKEKLLIIGQPVRWNTRLDIFALRELNFQNKINNLNSSNINKGLFTTEEKFNYKMTNLELSSYSLINYFCEENKCLLYKKVNDIYFFTSGDFIHISDYFSELIGLDILDTLYNQ